MKPRAFWLVLSALVLLSLGAGPGDAWAEPPRAVASIGPLHSLMSAVMEGLGTPYLLIRGAKSPHDATMTPADARALSQAQIVAWFGAVLETSLDRPIEVLATKARVVEVLALPGIEVLPARAGGIWKDRAATEPGQGVDGHAWLDPRNAAVMSRALAQALSELDPDHAARYRANAAALEHRLEQLEHDIAGLLAPVRRVPYFVFHDAYQYFERRFAMSALGAVSVNPSRALGAKRLRDLRARLRDSGAVCLFSEPQFDTSKVRVVAEGTKVRLAVLDPLGAGIEPGPEAYFTLMRDMADSLHECLSAGS